MAARAAACGGDLTAVSGIPYQNAQGTTYARWSGEGIVRADLYKTLVIEQICDVGLRKDADSSFGGKVS